MQQRIARDLAVVAACAGAVSALGGLAFLNVALPGAAYVAGAERLRRSGAGWPARRTAAFLAGSADRAYVLFGWSYETQLQIYRVLVFVLPPVVFWLTLKVCDELRRNEEVSRRRREAEAEARAAANRA